MKADFCQLFKLQNLELYIICKQLIEITENLMKICL